jgi:hypothetical protein
MPNTAKRMEEENKRYEEDRIKKEEYEKNMEDQQRKMDENKFKKEELNRELIEIEKMYLEEKDEQKLRENEIHRRDLEKAWAEFDRQLAQQQRQIEKQKEALHRAHIEKAWAEFDKQIAEQQQQKKKQELEQEWTEFTMYLVHKPVQEPAIPWWHQELQQQEELRQYLCAYKEKTPISFEHRFQMIMEIEDEINICRKERSDFCRGVGKLRELCSQSIRNAQNATSYEDYKKYNAQAIEIRTTANNLENVPRAKQQKMLQLLFTPEELVIVNDKLGEKRWLNSKK